MKMNISVDKKSIQEFFLQHTEKIVFTVVVVVLILMVYAAIARPVYLSAPQDLRNLADQARLNVLRTPGQVELRVAPYDKIADNVRRPVDPAAYPMTTPILPGVFPDRGKRGEPQTYPVEKLLVTSGFGAFSASGQAAIGGQGNRGYRWALITGLVPVARQTEAYDNCFRNVFPPEKNPPKYTDFEIERTEIGDQATDITPKWVKLDLEKADAIVKQWSAPAQELVPQKYLDEEKALVFPLGPIVSRAWDASVAHPPEIPVGGGNTDAGGPPAPNAVAPAGTGAAPDEVHEGTGHHHHHDITAPVPAAAAPKPDEAAKAEEGTPFFLFRFFDFTVEPNKHYRYHVRLLLKNPNFGQETRWLQDASLAEKEDLKTGWSAPTEPVFIPRDDRLLLVEIKPARGSMDAQGRFSLLHWNLDQGSLVWNEKWASRGQFMNFPREEAKPVATPGGTPGSGIGVPPPPTIGGEDLLGLSSAAPAGTPGAAPAGRPPRGAAHPTGPQADFLTQLLLIDMRGGDKQPGRDKAAKEPGEGLFLDADGAMVVHDEVVDGAEWKRTTTVVAPEKPIHHPKTARKPGAPGADLGTGETPPTPTPKPWARHARPH